MSTITILISLFFLCYLVLAIRRLDWALMLILAALPSYLIRFKILGVPFTLLEGMILLSFAVWVWRGTNFKQALQGKYGPKEFLQNRKKRAAYPFGFEIILLLLVSLAAVAVSGFSDSALGIWKAYFFEPALLFILILNVLKDDFAKVLRPLAVSALAVSALAIYQKITGQLIFNELWAAESTRRAVSFFGYPNAVGLYLAPLFFLFLARIGWLGAEKKKQGPGFWKKFDWPAAEILFFALVVALSLAAVFFAKSEGALVGMAAGLILFCLAAGKKIRLATLAVLVVAVASIGIYQPAREYAFKKIQLKDLSGEIRKQQWRETWSMLKDGRLFAGTGLDNYQQTVAPYHQEGIFFNKDNDPDFRRKIVWFDINYKKKYWQPTEIYKYPHNILLNFWTELGLAGLLLFVWLIGKFLFLSAKSFWRATTPQEKWLAAGLFCAMAAIAVHGLVDVPYFKNDLSAMFWVLFALVGLLGLRVKNSVKLK